MIDTFYKIIFSPLITTINLYCFHCASPKREKKTLFNASYNYKAK